MESAASERVETQQIERSTNQALLCSHFKPSSSGLTQSESSFPIVVFPAAAVLDLLARPQDKETQMNKEVAEEYSGVVPAKLVAHARLRHEVCEAHQAVE